MRALVTGGSGFIGSALCLHLHETGASVVNLDALTYAANPASLASLEGSDRYRFEHVDVADAQAVRRAVMNHRPDRIFHLAAETHVDRSIDGPEAFVRTNVVGTLNLLRAAQDHWASLKGRERDDFRVLHVSTDEVYGSLGPEGRFTEQSPYDPRSPYSASKAGADHLASAWFHTFGLPVALSNCSNNYGPRQFPEKLIPLTILNALEGKPLPVYGDGAQVRDWLHVEDHARALDLIARSGRPGRVYNVGGQAERTNLQVVEAICDILDELTPMAGSARRRALIAFVADRPGHDRRYAIDASRIEAELGWAPKETFEAGLRRTVIWYLENDAWWRPLRARYEGDRLGLIAPD